jgi:hypothetical protein
MRQAPFHSMIPKPANRFSGRTFRAGLFGQDHASREAMIPDGGNGFPALPARRGGSRSQDFPTGLRYAKSSHKFGRVE